MGDQSRPRDASADVVRDVMALVRASGAVWDQEGIDAILAAADLREVAVWQAAVIATMLRKLAELSGRSLESVTDVVQQGLMDHLAAHFGA